MRTLPHHNPADTEMGRENTREEPGFPVPTTEEGGDTRATVTVPSPTTATKLPVVLHKTPEPLIAPASEGAGNAGPGSTASRGSGGRTSFARPV